MPAILTKLRADHANFEKLLSVLDRQLAALRTTGRLDYDILRGVTEYFAAYPEKAHHPCEDAIFELMKRRDPAAAEAIVDLQAEHAGAAMRLGVFTELVAEILNEEEVERERFIEAVTSFTANVREHMALEERRFFPAAQATLTAEDWQALDGAPSLYDPLFDVAGGENYDALRQAILRWDREDRAETGMA